MQRGQGVSEDSTTVIINMHARFTETRPENAPRNRTRAILTFFAFFSQIRKIFAKIEWKDTPQEDTVRAFLDPIINDKMGLRALIRRGCTLILIIRGAELPRSSEHSGTRMQRKQQLP